MPLDGFLELFRGGSRVEGENLDKVFGPKHASAINSFSLSSSGGGSDSSKKKGKHGSPTPAPKPPEPTTGAEPAAKPKSPLSFKITKDIDLASPELFWAYCQHAEELRVNDPNKHPGRFDKAVVTVRKASGGDPLPFLVVTFERVFVTEFEIKTDDKKPPKESVTFTFRRCMVEYQAQKASGLGGNHPPGIFDFDTGKAE